MLHKLETRFGDQIKVKFIMGGLVRDIREFYDGFNDIGGNAEHSNSQIAKHWLEASERHGMPVEREGFSLFSDEYPSSYPQNIAYKAAQMEGEELANKFLRRMREATETEARKTNRIEVLLELAAEVGIDIPKFLERFSDGSAEEAFREDLAETARYGVRGFPTFLVRYGEKEVLLKGFQSFEAVKSVIGVLAGDAVKDTVPEKSEERVLEFIRKYGSAAPAEVQEAFGFSPAEAEEVIKGLEKKKQVRISKAGNGIFVEIAAAAGSCNPDSLICEI